MADGSSSKVASRSRPKVAHVGKGALQVLHNLRGLGSFFLITLGVLFFRFRHGRRVIFPRILQSLHLGGIRMMPMVGFLAVACGIVVVGQTVALLSRVGATQFLGATMVTVVVREMGPLVTAMAVLARVGTGNVVELGAQRVLGEVEALEALGVDPIHYLVVPRVMGLAISTLTLTVYFTLMTLVIGFLAAFIQDVPLLPGEYLRQIAGALHAADFLLLTFKGLAFGVIIAITTSYHGLARPLRLGDLGSATTAAILNAVFLCVLLDAGFIVMYLLTSVS